MAADLTTATWTCVFSSQFPSKERTGKEVHSEHTQAVQEATSQLSVVKRVKCISLQIPQIKVWFNQAYEQLGIMISVNNNSAIFNSYLIHHYSRANDKFPALCLLIKHWANRQLFTHFTVLHFLQVGCDPPVLPNLQKLYPDFFSDDLDLQQLNIFGSLPTPLPNAPRNNKSIGELLIAFFEYYNCFDFDNKAISISKAKL
uniref:PAP-associated domain-containing protein n=1 Tax=Ditylenchus dipsaci TaxID=166011 RepID=A0A915ER65_9BILA